MNFQHLCFFSNVVQMRLEKEPDSVSEEKVDLARLAEDVPDVLLLDCVKFVVQVEAAELRNEELEI